MKSAIFSVLLSIETALLNSAFPQAGDHELVLRSPLVRCWGKVRLEAI